MIWVLTMSVNDYNQHGDYLVAAWNYLPSVQQLMQKVSCTEAYAKYLHQGGGRIGVEDTWYHLKHLNSGELYKHTQ